MHMNWFSPLNARGTEIANHTARTLPALSALAEVTLWTVEDSWEPNLERYACVRRYVRERPPWTEMNQADINIYQLGNNAAYHGPIWEISRRLPGIVVLHDVSLQHFFAGYYEHGDRDEHVAHMARIHGPEGARAAQRYWSRQLPFEPFAEQYPLTPLATENALGILVHTPAAFAAVQGTNDCPAWCASLPYAARNRAASKRADGPPYRVVLFGYVGKNRRLPSVLQALAGMKRRDDFRLDIYGKLWNGDEAQERIAQVGVRHLVQVHGFVSNAELDAALDAAHLAVNLRHPTMGEASASQLRIWDHALPSLVSPLGGYASLPPDAVSFVRPDHEVSDIQAHLLALIANPASFAEQGRRGRRLLETEHAPERYAAAIVTLASAAQVRRRQLLGAHLAGRVGVEMGRWLTGREADASYQHVAEEIHRLAS
jgi:glycosyltransferase involved in cell wall biosynthesis